MQNILVIDSCMEAFQLIQRSLNGICILTWARTIAESKLLLNSSKFDLILLDVMLPDGNGFDLAKELQANEFLKSIPIIMLTAKDSLEDLVKSFEIGVEDYITKPFDRRELRARVHMRLLKVLSSRFDAAVVKIADLTIDKHMQRVQVGSQTIDLTSSEFKILMLFITNKNQILDRDSISDKVWGEHAKTSVRQVDAKVSRLRKKIGPDKIESIHGVGYRFVA